LQQEKEKEKLQSDHKLQMEEMKKIMTQELEKKDRFLEESLVKEKEAFSLKIHDFEKRLEEKEKEKKELAETIEKMNKAENELKITIDRLTHDLQSSEVGTIP
jgi:chromosome segregation ATPase